MLSAHTNPNRGTREGRIGRHNRAGERQTNTQCTKKYGRILFVIEEHQQMVSEK